MKMDEYQHDVQRMELEKRCKSTASKRGGVAGGGGIRKSME